MDARYTDLLNKLADQGWQVVHRDREVEWWADEIWTVKSIWAPQGFTLFLTWLRDPFNETTVWAIGAQTEKPTNRHEAEQPVCVSVKHWPRDVSELLTGLASLRNERLHLTT